MGTATQVTDFSDLYTDLQNRVREQTGVSATENQAKRYINIALHDMHIGHTDSFPWSERSNMLVTQPRYTTGSATISKGSAALTGVNGTTLWNTQNDFGIENMQAGGKITFAGGLDVYEISSVTNDYTAVLTGKYVGTSLTTETYAYFEDEYALASDFLRPMDQQYFSDAINIDLISRSDFRRRFPVNGVPGHPKVGTIVDKTFGSDTTPVRKIRFHPPPDAAYNIPYSYVTSNLAVAADGTEQAQLVEDDDEPIVPLRYRHVLIFHGLYHWYRDKKNDQRSQEAKGEYEQVLTKIANDTEIGGKHASIRMRRDAYVRRAKRPWQRGSARYDTNGKFDRMEI
jgi:hypothetical protein